MARVGAPVQIDGTDWLSKPSSTRSSGKSKENNKKKSKKDRKNSCCNSKCRENQNYKLELEILEKKLQLQKLMQTSPEVVRPIASTLLQGGFVNVVHNNQEFPQDIPTLDALRMR